MVTSSLCFCLFSFIGVLFAGFITCKAGNIVFLIVIYESNTFSMVATTTNRTFFYLWHISYFIQALLLKSFLKNIIIDLNYYAAPT